MLFLAFLSSSRMHIACELMYNDVGVQVNNSALAWPGCSSIGQSLVS